MFFRKPVSFPEHTVFLIYRVCRMMGTYTDKAGQKQARVHNHDIKIPADATPGNYHLMVYCLDRSGNETHVARNIVLSTTGGVESEHHHD